MRRAVAAVACLASCAGNDPEVSRAGRIQVPAVAPVPGAIVVDVVGVDLFGRPELSVACSAHVDGATDPSAEVVLPLEKGAARALVPVGAGPIAEAFEAAGAAPLHVELEVRGADGEARSDRLRVAAPMPSRVQIAAWDPGRLRLTPAVEEPIGVAWERLDEGVSVGDAPSYSAVWVDLEPGSVSEVHGLRPGIHRLAWRSDDGFEFARVTVLSGKTVEFPVPTPRSPVRLRVRVSGGPPETPSGVQVGAVAVGDSAEWFGDCELGEDGAYRCTLPSSGRYAVTVARTNGAAGVLAIEPLEVSAGRSEATLDIELPSATARVHVRTPDGLPVGGCRIALVLHGEEAPAHGLGGELEPRLDRGVTDSEGWATLVGLREGEHSVWVTLIGGGLVYRCDGVVDVEAGDANVARVVAGEPVEVSLRLGCDDPAFSSDRVELTRKLTAQSFRPPLLHGSSEFEFWVRPVLPSGERHRWVPMILSSSNAPDARVFIAPGVRWDVLALGAVGSHPYWGYAESVDPAAVADSGELPMDLSRGWSLSAIGRPLVPWRIAIEHDEFGLLPAVATERTRHELRCLPVGGLTVRASTPTLESEARIGAASALDRIQVLLPTR